MCDFCEYTCVDLKPENKEVRLYLDEDYVLNVDVDYNRIDGNITDFFYYEINYCPMCGKKLTKS